MWLQRPVPPSPSPRAALDATEELQETMFGVKEKTLERSTQCWICSVNF